MPCMTSGCKQGSFDPNTNKILLLCPLLEGGGRYRRLIRGLDIPSLPCVFLVILLWFPFLVFGLRDGIISDAHVALAGSVLVPSSMGQRLLLGPAGQHKSPLIQMAGRCPRGV